MVNLTMSPAIVAAIEKYNMLLNDHDTNLDSPRAGKPISHAQVIHVSRTLQTCVPPSERNHYLLDRLLKSCHVYVTPAKQKTEPTNEFKILMARLRREEEERQYENMTRKDTAAPRPEKSAAGPPQPENVEDDDMTYADVNRQVALIINVLVSIIACSISIWLVARHWSAPTRLALSMSGSGIVAVAEVVIYAGYISRLKEARTKERKKTETRVVTDTWVIEKGLQGAIAVDLASKQSGHDTVRKRLVPSIES